MKFSRRVTRDFRYFQSTPVNFGRKLGAVLAFAVGGVVACVSGIALLDPQAPSALALSNLQSAPVPVLQTLPVTAAPTVVTEAAVAPAEPRPVVAAVSVKVEKADRLKSCQPGDANCAPATAAKPPSVVNALPISPERMNLALSRTPAVANVLPGASKLLDVPATKPVVVKVVAVKGTPDTPAVRRPPAGQTPVAAATPAKNSIPEPSKNSLVEAPDLSPNVAEAEAAATPVPAKPKKAARPQQHRNSYDDRYRNRQNFFSFFWR